MIFDECTQTVSVLYAAIFGAGDACIDLSMASLGIAFAVFIGLVIMAQFVARKLWARLNQPKDPAPSFTTQDVDVPQPLGRGDHESPIKSSRF